MVETSAATVDRNFAVVIDDDDKIRQFLEATLTRLGMKVATFRTAGEALAATDRGRPGVIFLDVALLQSDAIDVLRGLGKRRYGGVVQLMSGGRPALLDAVERIGVRHGIRLATPLHKPLARETIAQSIEGLRDQVDPVASAEASAPPPASERSSA